MRRQAVCASNRHLQKYRSAPPRARTKNGPPVGGPFAGGCVPGDYFLDFFAGAAGAVAAGSWVLGWMASMTGVAMKTEA